MYRYLARVLSASHRCAQHMALKFASLECNEIIRLKLKLRKINFFFLFLGTLQRYKLQTHYNILHIIVGTQVATFTTATSKSLGSKLLPMALPFFPMTIAKINNWSAATCATDGFTVVAAALFALVFVVRGSASGHFFFRLQFRDEGVAFFE